MTKMKNVADIYPLTPTQQGMLYHSLTAPDSEVYFEQIRCELDGELDAEKLQTAWQTILDRHAVLRTAFLWDGLDTPLQVVRQTVTIPWDIYDWRDQAPVSAAQLDALAAKYRQTGFDLAEAPLLHLVLVRLADNRQHFIWNFHHLLLDGWSAHQLFNEVFTVYEMLRRDERLLRPRAAQAFLPPTRPFRHYLAWLKKQDQKAAQVYWRQQLAGFEAPTPLHIDTSVTDTLVQSEAEGVAAYAEAKLNLSPELTAALQTMAQQQRLTFNSVVQGAWALLLSRYSGEDDVVFGATLAGRPADLPGVEHMVGMFINTLPVRAKIATDQPVAAWLRQLQAQQLEMRQYEYSPLVNVQKCSDVPAGQALFESIVVYENYPLAEDNEQRSLQIVDLRYREQSNYPLALLVLPREALQLLAIYNPNRFSANSIERLLGHLQTLLAAMAADPNQLVADIPLLTTTERQQLVVDWNNTAVALKPQQCLHQFVTDHAKQMPHETAVVAQDQRLTYAQLNTHANQLAHRLLQQGLTPGTPVGLFVERSAAMLVGIVGILKAGGAYVPLDPDYPTERIEFVLADTQAPIIVSQSHLSNKLGVTDSTIISLSADFSDLDQLPDMEPNTAVSLDDLAYIIYTSGSTGQPKGVMVSHRNLLASTLARLDYYPERLQRFLLLSSFAFDSSLVGIFWTLLQGGTLVLPAADEEKDVARLSTLIAQEKITHTLALPSLYQLLLAFAPNDSLKSLQAVIVAGEACPPDLGAAHYGRYPQTTLYNEYGPTEATVWCTVYRLPPEPEAGPVPIGRPIANSQLLVLDRHQQLVPIGVPGELYVGGMGVTQGYRNRPELSAKRFVKLPFNEFSGLFYRTGDLVRWRADGQIEFLGRVDDQVKIRGYRIEPGEIETRLRTHPTVAETAVTVWERAANDKQLVAYIVMTASVNGNGADIPALQAYLGKQLPEYMVPTHFVVLPQLSRTPNGKIDHRQLPEPSLGAVRERPFIAPRTAAEKILARIWVDVLRLPQVSIEDKFFELGGDSIMSIRVIAKARQAGLKLTPRQMFSEQTIARLAAVATEAEQAKQVSATASGRVPLTPIQHWFFEQNLVNPHHWNQAQWFELETAVDPQQLTTALNHLIDHHAMLRARFRQGDTGWQQEIVPAAPISIKQVSLADLTPSEQDAAMLKTSAELHAALNLSAGPLVAAAWFDLGSVRKPRLLLSIHHLVVDAVSWGILTADLQTAYQQLVAAKAVVLSSSSTSFMQWSETLSRIAATEFMAETDFWLNKNMQPSTNSFLLTDYPAVNTNSEGNSKFVSLSLDAELTTRLLRDANQTYHTRIDDLLLTALVQTAVSWTGSSVLPVMLERHGREEVDAQLDVSQTVGWFTSLFPLTLTVEGDDLGANLRRIKEQLRRIPQNGLGYGILRYLGDKAVQQQLAAQPQPQILFNYLGQKEQSTGVDSVIRPLPAESGPVYGLANKRAHLLDVNAWVSNGRLHISWQYPSIHYRPETIEQLAQTYSIELTRIIDHCTGTNKSQYTPSDFPLSKLEQTDIDSLTDLLAALE